MKNHITRLAALAAITLLLASFALAAPAAPKTSGKDIPPFPGTLRNARFVYVASYDGDQFDPNLLPEDRQAINTVQDAMQKWGKFTLVYEPGKADIVLLVTSRPSEDILAVYDGHDFADGQFLWRVMRRSGLQPGETPLITDFEKAFEQAAARK